MSKISHAEHFEAVLADALADTREFVLAMDDRVFAEALNTDVEIERREDFIGAFSLDRRVKQSKHRRDIALAAAEVARSLADDYQNKRQQTPAEAALGRHFAALVMEYAEREAERMA